MSLSPNRPFAAMDLFNLSRHPSVRSGQLIAHLYLRLARYLSMPFARH